MEEPCVKLGGALTEALLAGCGAGVEETDTRGGAGASGPRFSSLCFTGSCFTGADFPSAVFSVAGSSGAGFADARFSAVVFDGAALVEKERVAAFVV